MQTNHRVPHRLVEPRRFRVALVALVVTVGTASLFSIGLAAGSDPGGWTTSNRVPTALQSGGLAVESFNPGANGAVHALAAQPDGEILVGGDFTTLGGGGTGTTARGHIARLNADGSLDVSFDPGANGPAYSLVVQSDGKVLVGGAFTALGRDETGPAARTAIGRLLADGSLDASFNPGASLAAGGSVRTLAVQPDGKILVGGAFTMVDGDTGNPVRLNIARLNADGSLDPAFDPGADAAVYTMAVQPDGKILVGGAFTTLGGGGTGTTPQGKIGRLNGDGSLDVAFNLGAHHVAGESVRTLVVQPDGKILVGGAFTIDEGSDTPVRANIGRLNPDGSLDATFDPGASGAVNTLALQANGAIVVGGAFTMLGGGGTGTTARAALGRLTADGAIDPSFDAAADTSVWALALQADGAVLVGGAFATLGGGGTGPTPRASLGRFTNTGDALQTVSVANDGSAITWSRSGTSPEVARVTFESSPDGSAYALLGDGVRTEGGWTLTELSLPTNETLFLRARGYYGTGLSNGSGSVVESIYTTYATTLTAVSGSGTYGGTGTLTATLRAGSDPIPDKTIRFALNGSSVGEATTDANGIATLQGVSLAGYAKGTFADYVVAEFAGDADYRATSGTGDLTVADDLTVSSSMTLAAGSHTYNNVVIRNNSVLTLSGSVTINAATLTVELGSSISASGQGYGPRGGPGGGGWNAGGTYGGKGAYATAATYGSALQPVDLGSGGYDAAGGGAIKLVIGSLTVNGTITANGSTAWYSGGSGGSIWVTAQTLSGSGSISANGGGRSWPGGGGRIAVYYTTSSFTRANAQAAGYQNGTVVFVDTANSVLYPGHAFRFEANHSPFSYNKVVLNNSTVSMDTTTRLTADELTMTGSSLTLTGSASLTVAQTLSLNGGAALTLTGAQALTVPTVTLNGSTLTLSGSETLNITGITLNAGSRITHLPQGKVNLTLQALTIDPTSSVSTDGQGYGPAGGPGGGGWNAGGTYGGKGAYATAATYGSALQPVDLGSGGYDAAGGGAIKLVIGSLTVNGTITANGSTAWYSGGSGGSIWVTAQTLSGSGSISANGGGRSWPGGGGRIAVYYTTSSFTRANAQAAGYQNGTVVFVDTANSVLYPGHAFRFQGNDCYPATHSPGVFTFNKIVLTGSAVTTATAVNPVDNTVIPVRVTAGEFTLQASSSLTTSGTVNLTATQFTQTNSSVALNGTVTVTVTQPLALNAATITFNGAQSLTAPPLVLNGSTLTLSGSETLNITGITLNAGSRITHLPQGKVNLTLQALTIDPTSSVSTDGQGYGPAGGPGGGGWNAGGTYGGKGAYATAATYGSALQPVDLGSGGYDAAGGGAIKLVIGSLTVNGTITANGSTAWYSGGSGGSIWVTAQTLSGSGSISANGGGRFWPGGGGRIAVYYTTSSFTRANAQAAGYQNGTVVFNQLNPPQFVSPSPSSGTTFSVNTGSAVTFSVNASDTDALEVITLGVSGLPEGASFPIPGAANPVSSTFSWTPAVGQAGNHTVSFTATDNVGVSAPPLSLTITVVDRVGTLASLASLTNPSTYGQPVTFTATVAADPPRAGTPTGTVQFAVDGANYGSPVTLSGSGDASISMSSLEAGSRSVTAVYSGDADFSGSTAPGVTQTVGKATATVTLGNLNPTHDGTPKSATATTVPAGLTVSFTYDGSATAPTEVGSYAVVATIQNANYEGSATGTLVIKPADSTPPTSGINLTPPLNGLGWSNTDVRVTLTASDNADGVGVKEIRYTLGSPETVVAGGSASLVVSAEGVSTLTYYAIDKNGNAEAARTCVIRIDKHAPTTTVQLSGTPGDNGWYVTSVTATLAATDPVPGSGVKELHYVLDEVETVVESATATVVIPTDGVHSFEYWAVDHAGNVEVQAPTPMPIQVDTAPPPVPTVTPAGTSGSGDYYTSGVTITVNAADVGGSGSGGGGTPSGISAIYYCINNGTEIPLSGATATIDLEVDGTYEVDVWSVDAAGNLGPRKRITIMIDKTAPTLTASLAGTRGDGAWWRSAVTVTLTASDATSGVSNTEYSVDGITWTEYAGSFTVSTSGTTTLYHRATDNAGNVSAVEHEDIHVDATAPVIGATLDVTAAPTSVDGAVANFTMPTATDAVDPAPAVTASPASGSLFPVGSTPVTVTARDAAGNEATRTFTVTVHKLTAIVTLDNLGHTYDGTAKAATATTAPGGLNVTITYSGSPTAPINAGSYTVTATVNDNTTYQGSASGTLVISQAVATVTAGGGTKVYGTAEPALGATTQSGFLAADAPGITLASTRAAGETVGTYPTTATATGGNLDNYSVTYVAGAFTITKAPLSVVANSKTRSHAVPNPVFDGTLTGVLTGDGITATYSTTATGTSLPGTYPIVPSLVDPLDKLSNYDASITNGWLTVTNSAPVCSAATPSVRTLWPANGKIVPVSVTGISDADGDPITISVISIFQDEPTNSTGDGNTAIDGAGVGTDTALVRAERIGDPKTPGNGRMYYVTFTASDGFDSCTGVVRVGVPHDQGQRAVPIGDGPRYDSTVAGPPPAASGSKKIGG